MAALWKNIFTFRRCWFDF